MTVSERVRITPPSGIRKFFDIAATMDDVISLGIGEPDFETPAHITQAAIDSLNKGETHYTSNAGTIELRRAIARNMQQLYGVEYNPQKEILVTVGVSEGLYLAMTAILDPGDEVIVPEPCFVAYVPEVRMACGTPVTIPTYFENNFEVTPEAIAAAITPKTKAILLGFPCNPTGAVTSRERLEAIAKLAEAHDLFVIADEIYDRLVYGVDHVCFSSLPGMRERTILMQGFSKAYAMTGWRAGYIAAPEWMMSQMMKVHQYTIMCAPTQAQVAALRALEAGEEDVQRMRAIYDQRRRRIVDGFNQIGLTCFEPRGAFYAFPSVKVTGLSSNDFAEKLLEEEKVATIPGSAFGACGEGFIRCSYASSMENIEEALRRMDRFVRRHR